MEVPDMLHSMFDAELHQTEALDEAELSIFKELFELPVDFKRMFDKVGDRYIYLESPEFGAFLETAERLVVTMMGVGRGLPGWDQSSTEMTPAAYSI